MNVDVNSTRISPNKRVTRGRKVRVIVMHLAITPETPNAAESVARYFSRRGVKASAHYCVDNNSIVRCVADKDVAWAAPGANHDGIQIELSGKLQSAAQWRDSYSMAMLDRAARLVAQLCAVHNIPVTHLSDSQLRAGAKGIIDHHAATRVYRRSTHTDCGRDFPWGHFMGLVARYSGQESKPSGWAPAPSRGKGTLHVGDYGPAVELVQAQLGVAADGLFGPITKDAVMKFQRNASIDVDGIVGPQTWAALDRARQVADAKVASAPAPSQPVLRVGYGYSAKEDRAPVARLQEGLNKSFPAYSKLHVDGRYGPRCAAVVKEFQRRSGLRVDGIVGPQTWAALGKHGIK